MDSIALKKAADFIRNADGMLIGAGAGMGVDSGLPNFRGDQGFWKAYPALGQAKMRFHEIANPKSFFDHPRLAWGFYGHRLQLYRQTVPHAGFQILRRIGETFAHGAFVYTSNVDGQFQKAGFSTTGIVECHGSIHHLQCLRNCTEDIWPAENLQIDVDEGQCLLRSTLPRCPHCGAVARPNILMFNDWSWLDRRTEMQRVWFSNWLRAVKNLVVVEIGAGTAVPTIRRKSESMRAKLVRINPDDADAVHENRVVLQGGALDALSALAADLGL